MSGPGQRRREDADSAEVVKRESSGGGWFIFSRILIFASIVTLVGYLVARTNYQSALTIESFSVPDVIPIGERALIALRVHNSGSSTVSGYAVVAIDDGASEFATQAFELEAQSSAEIPIALDLAPGKHVISLALYDVRMDRKPVDSRRGTSVQVGVSEVRAASVEVPKEIAMGETLPILISVANSGSSPQRVYPVAVFHPRNGGKSIEAESRTGYDCPAGETTSIRFGAATRMLEPQLYSLAVIFLDGTGEKVGTGIFGRSVRVVSQAGGKP